MNSLRPVTGESFPKKPNWFRMNRSDRWSSVMRLSDPTDLILRYIKAYLLPLPNLMFILCVNNTDQLTEPGENDWTEPNALEMFL